MAACNFRCHSRPFDRMVRDDRADDSLDGTGLVLSVHGSNHAPPDDISNVDRNRDHGDHDGDQADPPITGMASRRELC